MKINDQFSFASTQIQKNSMPVELNFEQWLIKPATENSGDEYYWQHQDQLEQSDLHFDPEPIKDHPESQEKQNESLTHHDIEIPGSTESSLSNPFSQNYIHTELQQRANNLLNEKRPTKIAMQQNPKSSQNITPEERTQSSFSANKTHQPKELRALNTAQYNYQPFKNHHLFIQDGQAELTLSTKDLNPEEQRELTRIMKHYIKQNSLALSKLIINGVEND